MSLLVLGINHRSAPVALRERVAFAPEQLVSALQSLCMATGLDEAVVLSTCNRTELYLPCTAEGDSLLPTAASLVGRARDWLAAHHRLAPGELAAACYHHQGDAALHHLIAVAAGLDSMVLGEPQIFGQIKSAYAVAREAGTVGAVLGRVFPHAFAVAKRVRTDTAVGENPVSVAYAAVSLTQHIFADLSRTRALLIGAGDTIELVARHLREKGVRQIIVANRTLARASALAQQFGAEAVLLADIPDQLVHTDIVISSTASQLPILGKGAVERALKLRKHRPILMVDIAVPRDIEPQVGDLSDVYLYTVDDLRDMVEENRRSREQEARKADELIAAGVLEFGQQLRMLDAVDTVRALRSSAEALRDAELERARRRLAAGEDAEAVLAQLARNLTNKLLHNPSARLRQASAEGRNDVILWSRELFGLSATDADEEQA